MNERVKAVVQELDDHLVIGSVLAGRSAGVVYADPPHAPRSVFVGYKSRLFLAGNPDNSEFNQGVKHLLQEAYFPREAEHGRRWFAVEAQPGAWDGAVEAIFGEDLPQYPRLYLECTRLKQDWRVPDGFQLRPVDADLLAETGLENMDYLRDELCSERETVAEFLEKSFGFCLVHGGALAGWCLSEYNTADRCEVGVATVEKYQRQGLATITTLALVEHALNRGYRRVGWHCWKNNLPSVELARRCGFEGEREYSVRVVER